MGILDDIRPAARKARPREVTTEKGFLSIAWDDGARHRLPVRFVRLRCPCAGCVDEWSGVRKLDPATVPQDVRIAGANEVGRYALQISWSDGHDVGLYSWELLRELGEEAAKAAPQS